MVIALFLVSTIALALLPLERKRQRATLLATSVLTAVALLAL